jgi:hypothetical protein
MAKTKHTTSTPSSPSPHQTRSKSPRKEVIVAERRTSPRAKKKTEKVRVDDGIEDTVPPPSSVAAAPQPIVASGRSKKKVGLPLPSKGSARSSIVAKRPLPADPGRQIATATELHPSDDADADIGKPSAADIGKPSVGDIGNPSAADIGKSSAADVVKPSASDIGIVPRLRSSSIDGNHLSSGGPLSNDYMESVAAAYLSKKPKLAHSSSVITNGSTNILVPRLAHATASQEASSVPRSKVPSTNDDSSLSDDRFAL